MTASQSHQGARSQQLGALAERTFHDLIDRWMGAAMAPIARLSPDNQRVDFVITLPSLLPRVPPVEQRWQIKSTRRASRTRNGDIRVALDAAAVRSLKDASTHRPLYLALGVQQDDSLEPWDLIDLRAEERFHWYAIDLAQYFRDQPEARQIVIPSANKLNLAMFALIWGGSWTQLHYEPLRALAAAGDPHGAVAEALAPQVDRSLRFGDVRVPFSELTKDLTEDGDQHQLIYLLSTTRSIGLISNELRVQAGEVPVIVTYCPESMWGTVNLWLFCRAYHTFMDMSAAVPDAEASNQRLLPVQPEELEYTSPLYLAALWLVVTKYRCLGVSVLLVEADGDHSGEDHAFYGEVVRYFPWIQIGADGSESIVGGDDGLSTSEHQDFLRAAQASEIVGDRQSKNDVAHQFQLDPSSLSLPARPPRWLLAPEDRFIRQPAELWQRNTSQARAGGPTRRKAT